MSEPNAFEDGLHKIRLLLRLRDIEMELGLASGPRLETLLEEKLAIRREFDSLSAGDE